MLANSATDLSGNWKSGNSPNLAEPLWEMQLEYDFIFTIYAMYYKFDYFEYKTDFTEFWNER